MKKKTLLGFVLLFLMVGTVYAQSPEEAFNKGINYVEKGIPDEAIVEYNRAIEINPDRAEAYFNRAIAYRSKGNYDQAIADYSKFIEINPDFARGYRERAVSYLSKQDYDKAWEDVHKAEELGWEVPADFLESLKEASGREK